MAQTVLPHCWPCALRRGQLSQHGSHLRPGRQQSSTSDSGRRCPAQQKPCRPAAALGLYKQTPDAAERDFQQGSSASSCSNGGSSSDGLPCDAPSELEGLMLAGGRMTSVAHAVWTRFVRQGDTVVDATCGNGQDCKWLAEAVGPSGRLIAFDIQEDAIRSTRAVLEDEVGPGRLPEVHFVQGCHSSMQEHVRSARLVCFNLGFLPGGERSVITRPDTTVAALRAALGILEPRGLVSVLCYVGHEGGQQEYEAVRQFGARAHPAEMYVFEQRIVNRPSAPVLVLFWKKPVRRPGVS